MVLLRAATCEWLYKWFLHISNLVKVKTTEIAQVPGIKHKKNSSVASIGKKITNGGMGGGR